MLRLVQFLFSMGLILAAFAGGLAVGWWRWGRTRRGSAGTASWSAPAPEGPAARLDLFAPELDLSEVMTASGPDVEVVGLEPVPVAALPRITGPAATTSGTR